jgi:NAD+ diphosphatase
MDRLAIRLCAAAGLREARGAPSAFGPHGDAAPIRASFDRALLRGGSMKNEMPFAAPEAFAGAVQPPAEATSPALWFVFRENELLVTDDHPPQLPAGAHPSALGLEVRHEQYLGVLGARPCFAGEVGASVPAGPGWQWRGLRSLFSRLDDAQFAIAGRALQLVDWNRTHIYCGRCGTQTSVRDSERSRECPGCGLVAYPRLAPAVMALVKREPDEILLARSHRFPPGMYSALAGFVEPGETLEQCLEREVFEEVGVRVRDVRYFASQPWPFPHSLMIAFVADWESGEIRVDPLEIEAAEWFTIAGLPQLPQPISIARRLIDAVIAELSAKITAGTQGPR